VKDLIAYQEVKRDFLLAWFAEFYDNEVENLSSKDHLTYHEAKERILNLPPTIGLPSEHSSKNSKPQHEANAITSSNGRKDKKKKKASFSSSNPGSKKCNCVISTYQALRPVIYGHSIMSLKHREIEMVPKWRLPSRNSLSLYVPTFPNGYSTPAHLLT
jgi:hypothetical protein